MGVKSKTAGMLQQTGCLVKGGRTFHSNPLYGEVDMIVVNSKEFAHCGSLPATVYTIFEKNTQTLTKTKTKTKTLRAI